MKRKHRKEASQMLFSLALPALTLTLGGGGDTVVQTGSLTGSAGQET